jgi:hypothetical protein
VLRGICLRYGWLRSKSAHPQRQELAFPRLSLVFARARETNYLVAN